MCQPCSSNPPSSAFFFPFPLTPERDASGQQTLLHWCLPQLRSAEQGLSQRISVYVPFWSLWHSTSCVVAPHRHGRTILIWQGGQDPVWHGKEQVCEQPSSCFKQRDLQVGIRSSHVIRTRLLPGGKYSASDGDMRCFPQGQRVVIEGDRGQGVGLRGGT